MTGTLEKLKSIVQKSNKPLSDYLTPLTKKDLKGLNVGDLLYVIAELDRERVGWNLKELEEPILTKIVEVTYNKGGEVEDMRTTYSYCMNLANSYRNFFSKVPKHSYLDNELLKVEADYRKDLATRTKDSYEVLLGWIRACEREGLEVSSFESKKARSRVLARHTTPLEIIYKEEL